MNKKKIIIVILILILIVVSFILIKRFIKKENSQVEIADNRDVSIGEDIMPVENTQEETSNTEPQEIQSNATEKAKEYTDVLSSEGVSEQLINNDKAIDFILQHAAMINSENEKNKIKLYIAIEAVLNNASGDATNEVPKSIVELAYKELFGDEKINYSDAYLYKYDSSKSAYITDSYKNSKSANIVKINKIEEKDGHKEIEYLYSFGEDDNSDCFKTTIKIKNNNEYSFSKYRILDIESMSSQLVGKVSDNK